MVNNPALSGTRYPVTINGIVIEFIDRIFALPIQPTDDFPVENMWTTHQLAMNTSILMSDGATWTLRPTSAYMPGGGLQVPLKSGGRQMNVEVQAPDIDVPI